jgi:hypothetical protein
MEGLFLESGNKTIWKDWECIFGQMEGSMRENTRMIRKTDMEFMSGLIKGSTWDIGARANSMELESI